MKTLVINAGSSSFKSSLFDVTTQSHRAEPLWEAQLDFHGDQAQLKTSKGDMVRQLSRAPRHQWMAEMLLPLWSGRAAVLQHPGDVASIGHRVVHGGRDYRQPTVITAAVEAAIERLAPLAPEHNPAALEGIRACRELMPQALQVAVFDTAFHSEMPDAAATYPGPYEWSEQGIRRYGFHGISHQYCANRTAHILGRELVSLRLVTCHLGNGCSLAAIRDGHSVDTTMGFTPLEGLMMGTRSGSVDPGILLYLMRENGINRGQLDELLQHQSGLLGISGVSGDVREVLAARAGGHPRALLAWEIYLHRLRSGIGAMMGSLGGLDALAFTGGVGEHCAELRAAVCDAWSFLGLKLDLAKNSAEPLDEDVATTESNIRVTVVHAQEDWSIALECAKLAR